MKPAAVRKSPHLDCKAAGHTTSPSQRRARALAPKFLPQCLFLRQFSGWITVADRIHVAQDADIVNIFLPLTIWHSAC